MRFLRLFALAVAVLSAAAPWIATPVPWILRDADGWKFPILGVGDALDLSLFVAAACAVAYRLGTVGRGCVLAVIGVLLVLRGASPAPMPIPPAVEIVLRAPIPYDGIARDLAATRLPAGEDMRHPLGTDATGRDVAARLLRGVRNSSALGLLVTIAATVVGIIAGLLLAAGPRPLRAAVDLFATVVAALPAILVLLAVRTAVGGGVEVFVAVLVMLRLPAVARVTHASAREVASAPFVRASLGLGLSKWHVYARTVAPHAATSAIALAGFGVVGAVLAESALGFLGLGLSSTTPSLGSLLEESRDLSVSGGIVAAVLGALLVGLGGLAAEGARRAAADAEVPS